MYFPRLHSEKGSALVIALVFIGIILLSITTMLSSTKVGQQWSRFFRSKATLEEKANSAIGIAKKDLMDRAQQTNGLGFTQPNPPSTAPSGGYAAYAVATGLVLGTRDIVVPRFITEQDGIRTTITYYPDTDNPNADDNERNHLFPKQFHVVAQAQDLGTGEKHTIESSVSLQNLNWSEISYGMLSPTFPPGVSRLNFLPSVNTGHVHFGAIPGRPYFGWGNHYFGGAVTFEEDPPSGVKPFNYDHSGTRLEFHEGYRTGFKLSDVDVPAMFDGIKAKALPSHRYMDPNKEICLKFNQMNIEVHDCNTAVLSTPFNRYGLAVVDTIPIPPDGLVIYSEGTVHVKGILGDGSPAGAQVTIATRKDGVIEGDVQYACQGSDTCNDSFGFMAENDVRIPIDVPTSYDRWDVDDDDSLYEPYKNVTNFWAPFTDRDSVVPGREVEYEFHWSGDQGNSSSTGLANRIAGNNASVLDVDGFIWAHRLNVEGLNDYTLNPHSGMSILALDGNKYSPDPSDNCNGTTSLYDVCVGGVPMHRKSDPVMCQLDADGTCPLMHELPRQRTGDLWIYGGLVTQEYSNTSIRYGASDETRGFARRHITFDPKLYDRHPPAVPYTSQITLHTLWQKSYRGDAEATSVAAGP